MFSEIIAVYGAQIVGTLLVAVFGILGMAARDLAAKYLDSSAKRTLARTVVRFAEQVYKDLHGQEKLSAALAVFASLLRERGIRASETEMTVLLEAAVAEFNNAFSK